MKPTFSADDLRLFVRIAECGALSKAAERFALPKSTLSRALSRLEQVAGAPLFDRKGGRLRLTEVGANLLPHAQVVADGLAAAEAVVAAQGGAVQGRIRVDAPYLFATRLIAPNLPRLLRDHPKLQVALDISPKAGGAHAPEADIMVRIGPIEDRALIARKIAESRLRLCVAEELLAGMSARDVAEASRAIVAQVMACDRQRVLRWTPTDGVATGVEIADPEVRYEMVRAGAGWAWAPAFLIKDDVTAGRVRDVTTGPPLPSIEIFALYSAFARTSPNVQTFLAFLETVLADEEALRIAR